jgi:hypothetical protein
MRQAVSITTDRRSVMAMNVRGSAAGICATIDYRAWLTP